MGNLSSNCTRKEIVSKRSSKNNIRESSRCSFLHQGKSGASGHGGRDGRYFGGLPGGATTHAGAEPAR